MTVYVDEIIRWTTRGRYRNGSCHLMADTLEELHAFARAIGLPRSRFHRGSKVPHYDLIEAEREQALEAGAVFVPAREQARRRRDARRSRAHVARPGG